ncbi:hypothetical protein HGA11_24345 [Mycolicibacterium septicum DSM 44393]|uniref:PE-PGRS family protein n=1 Tax=Mycolicibacterium septicum DSM 44393 TaxID=1341646 RepID=A0A7X6MUB4_9MYCO|nr:hypothetical protein [Mycolicibacterium septicum]NKZ14116.1 hypothetical protein [Mycolicibacterium septicum DSM 44393]
MQLASRSYLAAGVALVGASAIAVSPMAPPVPEVHMPVALTAAIENPLTVFQPVADATQTLISNIIERQTTNPVPVLRQLAANAVAGAQVVASTDPVWVVAYALAHAVVAAQALGVSSLEELADTTSANGTAISDALSSLGAGLPDALQAAGDLIAAGQYNEAIDSFVLAGQTPLINILIAVSSEINAVGKVLSIPQPLTDATGNAVLGVVLGIASTTIGIGYHLPGPQPLVQQFITSAQTVAAGAASGDPGTFVNALQHGIADFAADVVSQTDLNITMANSIADSYVNALKQITPKPFTIPDLDPFAAKALAAPAPAIAATTAVTTALKPAATPVEKTESAPATEATDADTKADTDATATDSDDATKATTKLSTKESPKAAKGSEKAGSAKAVRSQVKSAVKKLTDGLKKDKTAPKNSAEKKAQSSSDSAKGSDK